MESRKQSWDRLARLTDTSSSYFPPTWVDPVLPPSASVLSIPFSWPFVTSGPAWLQNLHSPFLYSLISTCRISSAPVAEKRENVNNLFRFLPIFATASWQVFLDCCLGHRPQTQLRSHYTLPRPFPVARGKPKSPRLLFITSTASAHCLFLFLFDKEWTSLLMLKK